MNMRLKPMGTSENVILVMMAFAAGLAAGDRLAFNILAPLIVEEMHLTNEMVGLLTAVFSCAYALAALGVGLFFREAVNRKLVLVLCIVVFSLTTMAGGLVGSVLMLGVTRVVMGLGEGPVLPFAQAILFEASSEKRRGFNTGLTQTFGGFLMGGWIAPLALGFLASHFGWRGAFISFAIPGLVLAVVIALFLRVEQPRNNVGEMARRDFVPAAGTKRNLLLCPIIAAGMTTWLVVQSAFLPLYLTNVAGYSLEQMTLVLSFTGIGGTIGAVVVPFVADRVGRKATISVSALLSCVAPLGALYFSGNLTLVIACIIAGWLAAGSLGVNMVTVPAESSRPANHTVVFGVVLCVSELIGAVVMPAVGGRMADLQTLATPLWICVAGAVWAALVALLLKETLPRRTAPALAPASA